MSLQLKRIENFDLDHRIGSDNCYGRGVRWLRGHKLLTAILIIAILGTTIGSLWIPSTIPFNIRGLIVIGTLLASIVITLVVGHEFTRQEIAMRIMRAGNENIDKKNAILKNFQEVTESIQSELPVIKTQEPLVIDGPSVACMSLCGYSYSWPDYFARGFYTDASQLTSTITRGCRENLDGYETPYLMLKTVYKGGTHPVTMTVFPNLEAEDPQHSIIIHRLDEGYASPNLHLSTSLSIKDFLGQVIDGTHPEYTLA